MKKTAIMVALLALGFYGLVLADEAKQEMGTWQGEVLDMSCYMAHGATGKDHSDCGNMCLVGGSPAGLLKSDGTAIFLVENHGKEKAYKSLRKLCGEKVTITGMLSTRGNATAITVDSVKKG